MELLAGKLELSAEQRSHSKLKQENNAKLDQDSSAQKSDILRERPYA